MAEIEIEIKDDSKLLVARRSDGKLLTPQDKEEIKRRVGNGEAIQCSGVEGKSNG